MSATLKNTYSPAPTVNRGKSTVISGDPKGKNFLYCIGNAVVIREIANPKQADIYYEHSHATTVAKYAPSGFYIASGDVSGTLRIWDTTQLEHPLKIELKALGGAISDIAWSADSQRIIVVGDGKERFGAAILWDTGASVGEISGHNKQIYSADFKPTRPFRAVTGSEDFAVNWFEGPPFKFKQALKHHTRFVNIVRFSPDGNFFFTGSSDKTGFFFDGKDATKKGALPDEKAGGHSGGIYAAAWSPDSKRLLTASGDKTAKIWNVSAEGVPVLAETFTFEGGVEQQQLGALWQGDNIITLNLNGDLSYLNVNNPSTPVKVLRGHNKFITALAYDPVYQHFYSGSYDGLILQWNVASGEAVRLSGSGHTNSVTAIHTQGDRLVTIGMDDTIRFSSLANAQYGDSITLDGPPAAIDVSRKDKGLVVVVTSKSISIIRGTRIVHTTTTSFEPSAVALSTNDNEIAVGGKDHSLRIYSLAGDSLKETKPIEGHRGPLTTISYSPDGKYLASADTNREIKIWDTASHALKINEWVFHTARVNALFWSESSKHLVSGSLDGSVYIWSIDAPAKHIAVRNAHRAGVNDVVWIDNETIATTGQDCSIKTWTVKN